MISMINFDQTMIARKNMKKMLLLLVLPVLFVGCASKMSGFRSDTNIDNGYTPLIWATFNNDTSLSKHLIESGENVNAKGKIDNYTPLLFACGQNIASRSNYEIAKLLIAKGADVNVMTNAGNTPLDIANAMQDSELVKLLIKNGARVNKPIKIANLNKPINSYESCTKNGGSWIWNKETEWHCGNLPSATSAIVPSHSTSLESSHNVLDKPVTIILLDGSGSMNEPDSKGDIKIISARKIIAKRIGQLDKTKTTLGLMAFNNGCGSTSTYVNINNQDFSKVSSAINSLQPNGLTPLAEGIHNVVESVKNVKQPVNLIIISDGMETCGGDPVYEAKRLMQLPNITAKIYVIGYDVDQQTRIQLQDIANIGAGTYNDVHTAVAFDSAMTTISKTTQLHDIKFTDDGSAFIFHVNFASDSDVIDEKSMQDVIRLAEYIKTNAFPTNIEGYTDNIASKEYNKALSKRRAESVIRQLIELGVNPKLLKAYGYGEERPIRNNNTEEGRFFNRRVEAHFIQ